MNNRSVTSTDSPVLVVDALPAHVHHADLHGKEADRLSLSWEQRRWMRGAFTTEKGRRIAFALPTGTHVDPGQVLWVDKNWYLMMAAAPESLLAIRLADRNQAVRTAFEIGNMHFPLALDGDKLLVPDDSAMVNLLNRLGVPWERETGAFQPVGKARPHEH